MGCTGSPVRRGGEYSGHESQKVRIAGVLEVGHHTSKTPSFLYRRLLTTLKGVVTVFLSARDQKSLPFKQKWNISVMEYEE